MRSALPAIAGAVLVAVVPAGDALAAPYASRTLREGKIGKDVRVLQRYLDRSGQSTHADGEFGPATVVSLRAFEASENQPADGVASRSDQRLVRRVAKSTAGLDASGGTLPPAASHRPISPVGVATIGPDGRAVAPPSAPKAVRQIIAAGNRIAATPYVYGGGHGSFTASGYDCSGSVSYALHAAGPPRHTARLRRPDELRQPRARRLGDGPGQRLARVPDRRRGALRHQRRRAPRVPLDAQPELGERLHRTSPQGSLSTDTEGGTFSGCVAAAPLASFTPQVRDWFARSFERPTAAQEKAWPAIAAGSNVLVSAPTGSGKTLAAFLWGLDRLVAEPVDPRRTRLVYVSPLKALSYDVEKNLRAPLKGIGGDVSVAIRTGDTPQRERQAMLRNPPDVLITTPESLYLMLTSRAREFLVDVEAVIVDEIHAVARTKRGAHMALTLERLEHLAGRPLQRIGLSATQRPLEEVGRFLVGAGRDCQIVDAGIRKPLDLKIHVPVENMREPDAGPSELGHLAGGEATQRSIWPAIYPELLELVREHRSTIIFVNNRRGAERLACASTSWRVRTGSRRTSPGRTTGRWPARSGWWSRTS